MRRFFRATQWRELTHRQRVLAGRVRDLLTAEGIKCEERIQSNGEPVYVFAISQLFDASGHPVAVSFEG